MIQYPKIENTMKMNFSKFFRKFSKKIQFFQRTKLLYLVIKILKLKKFFHFTSFGEVLNPFDNFWMTTKKCFKQKIDTRDDKLSKKQSKNQNQNTKMNKKELTN